MNVELNILDRLYKLACNPEQVEALKAAARHVDQKLRESRSAMPRIETERLAVMVALQLCQELMSANTTLQGQKACERLIGQMISDVETAIDADD
jgi:cell division protein ZapA